jgi:glutathione synthase/RimK-type ligase-like ATP-grasp enzyme
LLAACADVPDGGPEAALVELFDARGIDAEFAAWEDPAVDWSAADLIAIKATWDYAEKVDEFVSWARVAGQRTRVVNDAEVLVWNCDKRYLHDLADWGLPVVPSTVVRSSAELEVALLSYPVAVVKPVVGAGGVGVIVWTAGEPQPMLDQPALVQPFVESIRTRGEVSVFVMAARAVSQIGKHPSKDDVRVQARRGGRFEVEPLDPELSALASSAVGKVGARFGVELPYARVDFLAHAGAWAISEMSVIAPSLYLHADPGIAEAYVDALAATLG